MSLIETMQVIDSNNLSDLIYRVYGKSFSVGAEMEASNGSLHWLEVPEEVDEDGRQYAIDNHGFTTLEEWLAHEPDPEKPWRTGPEPLLQDVVNDLHAKGHIPAGSYRLHVWW